MHKLILLLLAAPGLAQLEEPLEPMDIFQLEWAQDPRPSPGGDGVVYVRRGMDVMQDRARGDLWFVSYDGSQHRPWTSSGAVSTPRWSPSGDRLAYVEDGQVTLRWSDTGLAAPISRLTSSPQDLTWSPDGRQLAFTMEVSSRAETLVDLPQAPTGAEWAPAPILITQTKYRADGRGYLKPAHSHAFVLPAEGGTPRQVTSGAFDHGGPLAWSPDGKQLFLSANRREDREEEPNDSELYQVELEGGELTALTNRRGPDSSPTLSPDGTWLAWLGHDERYMGYHNQEVYLRRLGGGDVRCLTEGLDRSVGSLAWAGDGRSLLFTYDDHGDTRLARLALDGSVTDLAAGIGGTSLGRPYSSGSVALGGGRVAFTYTSPQSPADVAVLAGTETVRLTDLNGDLFTGRALAGVTEHRVASSAGGLEVQYWVARPPHFDPTKRYPLLLEIHGGPFANYGSRFAMEVQLYAAAGYVVVYANPRGSTSYGDEFANLIHHAYPGEDYDDLMSCVDAVASEPWIDEEQMFVTGGSGGGVLTAWIVGKTDRFRAAVVAKPVINWTSFALTADAYTFFYRWWFPGLPWEHQEHYWRRSPLSLVGSVTTPTMLLTGEEDWRTPISESEQYYQALRLAGVESALVRIPGASHGIARRPSQMMAKVLYVLGWFERER